MLTEQIILPESVQKSLDSANFPEHTLLFDIETTGLDHRRSHIYLIGLLQHQKEEGWRLFQYFAEKPLQEEELLRSFSHHCTPETLLIHFNGDTFDLPYLRSKYEFYGMKQPWLQGKSIDIYKKVRPFQRLLGLSQSRQRDWEEYCGLHREDPYSGGELIGLYREFLQTGDEHLYRILLRHNREDLSGMVTLLPLLTLEDLRRGQAQFLSASLPSRENPRLSLTVELPNTLPFSLTLTRSSVEGHFQGRKGTIRVPLYQGILKYFYPNYRDYYYLPLEDTAIHKSVGTYVDKKYRCQAKASNCYQKKEGLYLPQFTEFHLPGFRREYGDSLFYFAYLPQEWEAGSSLPPAYACHLLQALWGNK